MLETRALPDATFAERLLPDLIILASDRIVNVRIGVARALARQVLVSGEWRRAVAAAGTGRADRVGFASDVWSRLVASGDNVISLVTSVADVTCPVANVTDVGCLVTSVLDAICPVASIPDVTC